MQPVSLTIPGVEAVYDLLATAIDEVGPGKSELFLVKLALLQANTIGDPEQFRALLKSASADL